MTTYAGIPTAQTKTDGLPRLQSGLATPYGVAVDSQNGNVYIADVQHNRVAVVNAGSDVLTTFLGINAAGHIVIAPMGFPRFILCSTVTNSTYVSDTLKNIVYKIDSQGKNRTVAGVYSNTAGFSGDGTTGPALLRQPMGMDTLSDGSLLIADSGNGRIRLVNSTTGIISTVAGGGTPNTPTLSSPAFVTVLPDDTYYICDKALHVIFHVNPAAGTWTTVVGKSGIGGFAGDGGPAVNASLYQPYSMSLMPDGTLLISDQLNYRIRAITPDGVINTIAGSGSCGTAPCIPNGDGDVATSAFLSQPGQVSYSGYDGSIFIADSADYLVRQLLPATVLFVDQRLAVRPSTSVTQLDLNVPVNVQIGTQVWPTTGPISVNITVTTGMSIALVNSTDSGWTCDRVKVAQWTCTWSSVVEGSANLTVLTAWLNIGVNATTQETITAVVFGGGLATTSATDHLAINIVPLILSTSSGGNGGGGGGGSDSTSSDATTGIAVGVSVAIVIMIAGIAVVYCYRRDHNAYRLRQYSEFELMEKIGEGASSDVYKAKEIGPVPVAVKVLRTGAAAPTRKHNSNSSSPSSSPSTGGLTLEQQTALKNFRKELIINAHLRNHPNVVEFFGGNAEMPNPFMAMKLMDGGSMEKLLIKDRQYPIDNENGLFPLEAKEYLHNLRTVTQMLLGAASGLLHLHANAIIHRDVSSRNFLVGADRKVRICDFGMSQRLEQRNQCSSEPIQNLHGVGDANEPIPLAWCAPETLQDRIYSTQTDVYAFGIFLHEIIARNENPYGFDPRPVVPKVISENVRPTIPDDCKCPREWVLLMIRCWNKDPSKRPSMEEVVRRLSSLSDQLNSIREKDNVDLRQSIDSVCHPSALVTNKQRSQMSASFSLDNLDTTTTDGSVSSAHNPHISPYGYAFEHGGDEEDAARGGSVYHTMEGLGIKRDGTRVALLSSGDSEAEYDRMRYAIYNRLAD